MAQLEIVHPNGQVGELIYPNAIALVLDANTEFVFADKPVFGATVTIRDDLSALKNTVVHGGDILGWLNYASLSTFACLRSNQYFDAANYFYEENNLLLFKRPLLIHQVFSCLNDKRKLMTFSIR